MLPSSITRDFRDTWNALMILQKNDNLRNKFCLGGEQISPIVALGKFTTINSGLFHLNIYLLLLSNAFVDFFY